MDPCSTSQVPKGEGPENTPDRDREAITAARGTDYGLVVAGNWTMIGA